MITMRDVHRFQKDEKADIALGQGRFCSLKDIAEIIERMQEALKEYENFPIIKFEVGEVFIAREALLPEE